MILRQRAFPYFNPIFAFFRWRHNLSARFFVLTMIFFFFGSLIAIIPPLNNHSIAWLEARVEAAYLTHLSLAEIPPQKITLSLQKAVLNNARLVAMVIIKDETPIFNIGRQALPEAVEIIDLQKKNMAAHLLSMAKILLSGGGRILQVIGETKTQSPQRIEILINDRELYEEMLIYFYMILSFALIIALIIGGFLFMTTHYLFIRPLRKLSQNMSDFQKNPEDSTKIITPHKGKDEICEAEYALANMQTALKQALHQKTRLAGLGLAVNKINHDLRNLLSSAQLIADRLTSSEDPSVRAISPRLISSLGRAIDLCTRTLEYGRAEGRNPKPQKILLRPLVEEVASAVNLPDGGAIQWVNETPPDLHLWADYEYIFRILLNLGRNAIQAIQENKNNRRFSLERISIAARHSDGMAHIDIRDTGPGLSLRARANLFMPFAGSTKAGGKNKEAGFGLGLPIARELARASGGDLTVVETGDEGTVFCFTVPTEKMRPT